MGSYELSFLTGLTVDQIHEETGDSLLPSRLVILEIPSQTLHITKDGRETLRLIEAFEAGRRADAACQGVGRS
jgi:hypothetical protein